MDKTKRLMMETTILRRDAASNEATRQRANLAASPISRLPTELFVEIIRLALPSVEFTLGQLAFCAFDHVCRLHTIRPVAKQWQQIIDGTPMLWKFVASTLPPHVNEATIRRSGTGSLVIVYAPRQIHNRYTDTWPSVQDFLEPLADTFPRWSAYSGPIVPEYLNKPALCLQKIILIENPSSKMPLELLGGSTENLRHVHLSDVSIRWKTGLFTQLSVLKLENIGDDEFTTTHLFDILHSSPRLEHLELEHMSATVHSPPDHHPITLPGLRHIHFRYCEDGFTGTILRRIQAPSCIEFHLEVILSGSHLDVLAFLNEDLQPFRELLRVAHTRHGSSKITLYDNSFEWESSRGGDVQDDLSSSLYLICDYPNLCIHWAESILQDDPVLSIRFDTGTYVSEHVLEAIAPMRSVTRVEIEEVWSINDLLLALEFMGRPLGTNPSLPSLPCLRELLLRDLEWSSQNLLDMVHSRFNLLSWEGTSRTPLTINIPREPFGPGGYSRPILNFTTLMKIREIEGVERVQLVGSEELDGMVAITWDEPASSPVRG